MADTVRPSLESFAPFASPYLPPHRPVAPASDPAAADGDVELHRRVALVDVVDRRSAPRPRSRALDDPTTGARWCVVEADASTTPGARAPRCLLFFSAGAVRRVWDYPAGWLSLPDPVLLSLSEAPVGRGD